MKQNKYRYPNYVLFVSYGCYLIAVSIDNAAIYSGFFLFFFEKENEETRE